MKKVGAPFCTNVLRIALNSKEESIASTIISKYNVFVDEKMLIRAIKTNQMQFIYCLYAFNKNYERILGNSEDHYMSEDSEDESSTDEDGKSKQLLNIGKYKTFTFDQLFKIILSYCPDSYLPKIRAIAAMGIFTSENFLMSLLINRQDVIAADPRFIKYFELDLTIELLIFSIRNQNEMFLRYALSKSLLPQLYFIDEGVQEEILG